MEVAPENRLELLQTLRSMTKEIRKIKGCKNCNFYQNGDNENIFSLIEEWKTQEELDSHLKSDMFGVLIGTKNLLVEPAEINIKAISYTAGMEDVKKARERSHAPCKKEEKKE
jgi:quinol monooxygenase YgiN